MPTDQQVAKAIELMRKSGGNHEYFFEKLSSPEWIKPLAARGRFDHPPPTEHIGTAYRFPPWPEGQYLLRMAGLHQVRSRQPSGQLLSRATTISFIACWWR
jgi:hypothetical protein